MDALHREIEEWGSLNLSSVLLSPPEYKDSEGKRVAPFDFGLEMSAKEWFEEAGKTEGTADFSERILNVLMLSATVKATPEDALNFQMHLDKLGAQKGLYDAQVRKYQVQEEDRLKDYEQQRRDLTQARTIEDKANKDKWLKATTEREESDLILNRRKAGTATAQATMRRSQVDYEATQRELAANPNDPVVQERARAAEAARDRSKTDYERAKADEDAAAAERTAKQDVEASAQKAYTDGLANAAEAPKLIEPSDLTIPKDSPTLGEYKAPSADDPGSSLESLKKALSSMPDVKPTDISKLGDGSFAKSLRSENEGGVFPARSRLIEASGNKAVQEIFNFLGDPAAALTFKDKPILFGVGTVAADPGWRTFADYDGQLDVQTTYRWVEARRETAQAIVENAALFPDGYKGVAEHFIRNESWPQRYTYTTKDGTGSLGVGANSSDEIVDKPLVAAVSPLMERQAMDLTSSRARQDEVAIFLSAALAKSGFKGQGEAFDKYVKMRRQDVATRSVLPVLNAYNAGGGIFGFQFGPRLDALDQPGAKNPKPARQLGKQSFPVLIAFGFSKDDLRPRLFQEDGRLVIKERALVLTQTTRWSRQRKRGAFHSGLRSVFAPGYPGRPPQDPSDRYERILDIGKAINLDGAFVKAAMQKYRDLSYLRDWQQKVGADLEVLNMHYFGGETQVSIPVDYLVAVAPRPPAPPTPPAVINIFPSNVEISDGGQDPRGAEEKDWQAEIVIGGKGLDQIDVGNIKTEPAGFGEVTLLKPPVEGFPGKQAMAVRVYFKRTSGIFQLRLPVKAKDKVAEDLTPIFTPLITVSTRLPRPALDVATPAVLISRKAFDEAKLAPDNTKVVFADIRLRTREIAPLNIQAMEIKAAGTVRGKVVDVESTFPSIGEVSVVVELTVPKEFVESKVTITVNNAEVAPMVKLPGLTTERLRPKLVTLETQPITIKLE